jgi:glucose-1-phosphate cytidylyltransferase
VTYGDGLTDADLSGELRFHLAHDCLGTVLGVNPPSRFGEFKLNGAAIEGSGSRAIAKEISDSESLRSV